MGASHAYSDTYLLEREAKQFADQIIKVCGWTSVFHINAGAGFLVQALCERGIDAKGIDNERQYVEQSQNRCPGRIILSSPFSIPEKENSIETLVVSLNEVTWPENRVEDFIRELFRVSNTNLIIKIQSDPDNKVQDRLFWENRLVKYGFRKHPRYYLAIPYESLEYEDYNILIVMEKSPNLLLEHFPLHKLAEERGLHMDMSRETGRRSDAHMIRYHEAAKYIRPGDRVLDAACGLGYGTNILLSNSLASKIVGIDGSDYAIQYASLAYAKQGEKISFRSAFLPEVLAQYPDASFDFIASFETLEHLENPEAFLKECLRILTPGGRILVSVPNDWTEEDGKDPNPYHFHVYEWSKLLEQTGKYFLNEKAFVQSASRKKIDNAWAAAPREWIEVSIQSAAVKTSEWCLVLAMKDPTGGEVYPYKETLFPEKSVSQHPNILDFTSQYKNPWLVRSMISIGFRITDLNMLALIASRILEQNENNADAAAALCIEAYQSLDRELSSNEMKLLFDKINPYIEQAFKADARPVDIRWGVSLSYVKGLIEQKKGLFSNAIESYENCTKLPFEKYSILLATKTIDASFRLGVLCYQKNDKKNARKWWRFGIDTCQKALHQNWDKNFGSLDSPPDFSFRELTAVLDNATQCASALSNFENLSGHPIALERVFINKQSQVNTVHEAYTIVQDNNTSLVRNNEELRFQVQKLSSQLEQAQRLSLSLQYSYAKKEEEDYHKNILIDLFTSRLEHASQWKPGLRWVASYIKRRLLRRPINFQLFSDHGLTVENTQQLKHNTSKRLDYILVENSDLFDKDWYISNNPDLGDSDPIEHFIKIGGIEGRSASPRFDCARYLDLNLDIKEAKLNPLIHYLRYGHSEGRYTGAEETPIRITSKDIIRRYKNLIQKSVREVGVFEAAVTNDPVLKDMKGLPWTFSLNSSLLWRAWKNIFNSINHDIKCIVFVPWLAKGGADLVAVNIIRAAIEKHGSNKVLLVLADYDNKDSIDWLPDTTQWIAFSDFGLLTHEDREKLIESLVFALQPTSVINVNSYACWDVFSKKGKALSQHSNLFVYLFCHDYDSEGKAAGYAATHFYDALPYLTKVYFDNATFLKKLCHEYNLSEEMQKKLVVLRQPTPQNIELKDYEFSEKTPFPILWAGRFCKQKNIDILLDIARLSPEFKFDIFGKGEKTYQLKLEMFQSKVNNFSVKGEYSSFEDLPIQNYGALLFTSLWEGLPTTLLIAGAFGMPIIASNVGGISELIDETTGWLITDYDNPKAYITALKEVQSNPPERRKRSLALRDRIHLSYSWESFIKEAQIAPSFLD